MAQFTNSPKLSTRFSDALVFAHEAHNHQVRKQNEVPYISHLLAVASLVLESGGNENEAIAALLHDCVEDLEVNPQLISKKFGENVRLIVLELSEDKSWIKRDRKKKYAQSILTMSPSALRVSVADKLHNIRCYAASPELWGAEQVEFYIMLLKNYQQRSLNCEFIKLQLIEMWQLFENLS